MRGFEVMIKQKRRFGSSEARALVSKPQYKIYGVVKDRAVKAIVQWLNNEFELHGNQGGILANEIVLRVIEARRSKIHPTAPDVFLVEAEVLEWVIQDSKQLAEEMNNRDELEAILDQWETSNERLKHGL